jgi:hypothetical protein
MMFIKQLSNSEWMQKGRCLCDFICYQVLTEKVFYWLGVIEGDIKSIYAKTEAFLMLE